MADDQDSLQPQPGEPTDAELAQRGQAGVANYLAGQRAAQVDPGIPNEDTAAGMAKTSAYVLAAPVASALAGAGLAAAGIEASPAVLSALGMASKEAAPEAEVAGEAISNDLINNQVKKVAGETGKDILNLETKNVGGGQRSDVYNREVATPSDAQSNADRIQQILNARIQARGYADGGDVYDQAFAPQNESTYEQAFAPQPAQSPTPTLPVVPLDTTPVNVRDLDGNVGSIPAHQLEAAKQAGYQVMDDSDVHAYVNNQKYGTPGQTALAALEGAVEGATFGLSTGVETFLGVDPEAIRGRREASPFVQGAGQVAGIATSSLIPGVGAANLLDNAGLAVAKAVLPAAETATTLSKVGSAAVKLATENAMVGAGDEVSKAFSQDPDATFGNAIANIGLSGLVGGGVGALGAGVVSPLWKATIGDKLDGILQAYHIKAGGVDGFVPANVDADIAASGIKTTPAIRAAVSGDPQAAGVFSRLEQEDVAKSGKALQKESEQFRNDASEETLNAIGYSADDIANYSKADLGRDAMNTFKQEFRDVSDPISEGYNGITDKFKNTPLTRGAYGSDAYLAPASPIDTLSDNVSKMALANKYTPTMPETKIVNQVLEQLGEAKNVQDISEIMTQVRGATSADPALRNVGRQLRDTLLEGQQNILGNLIQKESPELFDKYVALRGQYAKMARVADEAGSQLSIGKFHGPKDFLDTLEAKRSPEEFLNNLSPKKNAEVIPYLQQNFPKTLEKVRQNELMDLARPAVLSAKGKADISVQRFNAALAKASPELRDFMLTKESQGKLGAIQRLLEGLNDPTHNFSNTARTIDKLMEHVPGSATAMISLATGHNPLMATGVGAITKTLGKDIPAATNLAWLRFMGSKEPINSGAFATMVKWADAAQKGAVATSKATKGVFSAGREVLSENLWPTDKDTDKLDASLQKIQKDPSSLLNVGNSISHYAPDHAQAISQNTMRVSNYLNGIRPGTTQSGPLDKPKPPSKADEASFKNALTIAEQPLVVMDKLKSGSLTSKDILHLNNMYPQVYQNLKQKLSDEMINASKEEDQIPYKIRQGLSLFMGQPLDSTMTPGSIMAAQAIQQPTAPPAPPAPGRNKKNTASLGKMNKMYQTPDQAAIADRQDRS